MDGREFSLLLHKTLAPESMSSYGIKIFFEIVSFSVDILLQHVHCCGLAANEGYICLLNN